MRDQGIGSWPARRARMTPDRVALVQDGVPTTYAELADRAGRFAQTLRERGVARGERVAFLGRNSVEFVITMFAAAQLGAVFVPLNTRLAGPETAAILADCSPRLLVRDLGLEAPGPEELVFEAAAGRGLDQVLTRDGAAPDEAVGLDDLFMIQYTSGTGGRPKGVRLSHGNIVWNVFNLLVDVDVGSDEVALVTAPLFHTAALNQVLLPTLLKGGKALVEAQFDAGRTLALIEQHGVTLLFGVTSMYQALARDERWASADLSTLRSALSGGAPIPESLLRTWLERGLAILQGYGLTEASPGATMLRAADGLRKLGSAGTSCFFSDVRVVTPDRRPVPAGEPGEVLVQGPNVTSGYWNQPQLTAQTLSEDGWLHSGDLAVVDQEGYLHIVGRLKDMYISGGENVYPAEVEEAIYTHPAVAECAVIGVPDQTWGEVGRAVIVLHTGRTLSTDELLAHLQGRLARYKHPRSVVFTDHLPHNASGKLVKSRVLELHGLTDRTESAE
ncbi:long-chain fatty acid--CoA ligase [Kineosporia rhizophila]|uniref:acyl-CoA synthetase n=1 Tax=Kineosporia rhizophila TaxID=84633 RepID=UPI001E572199|nr:long-chain fatty acid--CoA ligase [Kineosporia rhizophila]MCE0537984.1 long-chain fatty acid--CoA ligase [Kineosporia rhizophila]